MKRLVVFDLDGTLTLSRETDEGLFAQSIREVLGIKSLNTDWTTYRDVTNIGVIAELIERHGLEQTVQSVQDRFITLLRSDLDETPCREVPGAAKMLSVLSEHPDFEYSVATGSWRESALLKIRSAGLVIEVLATCDDSPQREQLTRMSIQRARSQYNLAPDTPVTLVGDAPWDVRVATNLELDFVGIGSGQQAERLLECGTKHVIEDFTDVDRFLELVAQS
jgi:phosphoglycolate phosphatase-like HAD superfamily hydrolase